MLLRFEEKVAMLTLVVLGMHRVLGYLVWLVEDIHLVDVAARNSQFLYQQEQALIEAIGRLNFLMMHLNFVLVEHRLL